MFGRMKRHWLRLIGVAGIFSALWLYYEATQVDEQWDQQIEETEGKWKEIDKQLREKTAAYQKASNRFEKNDIAYDIVALQNEHYTAQRESLRKTQELYYKRYNYSDYSLILNGFLFGFIFGSSLWRIRPGRKRCGMSRIRSCKIETDEGKSPPET